MDLKQKIEELQDVYTNLETQKAELHEEMKKVKKLISKYETVLKHAQEIEAVEDAHPTHT